MILLVLACQVPVDTQSACRVFQAASNDLVSPEHDDQLEQTILALARTLDRDDLPPGARASLLASHSDLVRFALERSRVRSERVYHLVNATLAPFGAATTAAAPVPSPPPEADSLEEATQQLLQRLAHDRGRDRRALSEVEARCTPE